MSDELAKSLQYSVNQKFGRGAYQVLEPIKRGADGYVYKIEFIREKKLGALKVLPKAELVMETDHKENLPKKHKHEQDLIKKAENEIRIHSLFKSGYIIKLINSFSDEMNFYIMMEYVPKGDLGDEIGKFNNGLLLSRIRKIGLQLAKGIDTIHKKSVIHRDIKPRNILLTGEDEIKICDFSCAKETFEEDGHKTQGVLGSLGFIAPEIIGKYGNSVDVWSFGCVLYTMLTGKIPFKQEKKFEQRIEKEKVIDYLRKVTDESVRKLVSNLYENHHLERPEEILENQATCSCKVNSHKECYFKLEDLLQKIFILKASERIMMSEIISHPFFTGEEMKITDKILEGKDLIYDLIKPKKAESERSQTRPKSHQSLEFDRENAKEGNRTTRTMILPEKERHSTSDSTNKFGQFKRDQINQNENINISNLVKPKVQTKLEELINSKLNQPIYSTKVSAVSCIQPIRSQSPLNCEGIYYSFMYNPNEKVVIDEKGLRAEFNKSEKVMQITPKGGHVILGFEGKSRKYELNKLPDKYMTFYLKYKEVVKQVKNKMAKRGESANGRGSRTSKTKHNQSHASSTLENHEKSKPISQNSSQYGEIAPHSQVEIPICLPSSYLNIVFQLSKNSQRTSLSLVSPVMSQNIWITHIGELRSAVGDILNTFDQKITSSEINQIVEELDRYYRWIQTMPILQEIKKSRQASKIEENQKYSSRNLLNYNR